MKESLSRPPLHWLSALLLFFSVSFLYAVRDCPEPPAVSVSVMVVATCTGCGHRPGSILSWLVNGTHWPNQGPMWVRHTPNGTHLRRRAFFGGGDFHKNLTCRLLDGYRSSSQKFMLRNLW
ncbi:MC051 [Molluscum contagiosum virus subtype 2]|uniref:MC051 n=2 Tax=Molluscum contagiosum virus TaxID=10279 RepID=A0A1S7DLN2_MCV2|nr:MC051 [Molluscum contagiosum virus subtype 2]QHW16440.1 MC051L [Molluscum contagiosum virus]AYO87688.1 MC051 [Molluscum contagiosum virus subtype 2]AYO87858.1 MC051 [Molluscum contagiosum virus subtype 2]AYO88028.1 MC051 [Molluscum contagiosum virus subtype 2]